LCAFVLLGITGCKTIPLHNYSNQALSSYNQTNSSFQRVEKAIVKGAVALGWEPIIKPDGSILTTLNLRKHQLIVLITHDDKTFSIDYKDSKNLLYKVTKKGKIIHRKYSTWIDNLIKSINAQYI